LTRLKGEIYLIRIGFAQVGELCVLDDTDYFIGNEISFLVLSIQVRSNRISLWKEATGRRPVQNADSMFGMFVFGKEATTLKHSRVHYIEIVSAHSIGRDIDVLVVLAMQSKRGKVHVRAYSTKDGHSLGTSDLNSRHTI